ncbi:MAG: DUF2062 domain-containing protein [Chthoniobacterales bacterium]
MSEETSDRPSVWQRFRHWLAGLHLRVMTIEDTPHSIALGLAIGVFFGFTPFLSLKTLLSIGVAWLLGCNKIAAAVSVQLHDLLLPFMPAIYLWEYKLGYWALHGQFPRRIGFHPAALLDLAHWRSLLLIGPTFVGSIIVGVPSAAIVYFVARGIVVRHRARRVA